MEAITPMENESPKLLETTGVAPQPAEPTTDIPHPSAGFRTLPQDTEEFGKMPNHAERKENHTLTVRETARMFETAGVARTERSIINWCQPNRQGITRLDSYYDPNERKYYITPQSVESAIQEEIQRAKKSADAPASEAFGTPVAHVKHAKPEVEYTDDRKVQELEQEIRDLKITNRTKDLFIEQLKDERDGFFEKLLTDSRMVGQLENRLLQVEESDRTTG